MKNCLKCGLVLALAILFATCSAGLNPSGDQDNQTSQMRAAADSPVALHGMLKVSGNRILDASDQIVQFKGMSFFWSQWSTSFWNASVVDNMVEDWGCTILRAAMGVDSGGYLDNPDAEKARVITVVDAAIDNGIYVIIDWHDHDAVAHQSQSIAFFQEMAQRYKDSPNVIFEIFNEPDYETWPEVKGYAEAVIGAIRAEGADNIVVVGSPTWSQDVDIAAADPITGFDNVAYSLHFYAATHKQSLRDKADVALNAGLALFATE
nr:glycoside hydrolase family 5 protein [Spirochaetaceae bacterium]